MISNTIRIQHLHTAYAYQGKPHFHDQNEILFTMDDDALMYIDQAAFPLRAGTLTLIASGSLHAKVNNRIGPINSYVIHYPPAILSELSTRSTNLSQLFANTNYCMKLEPGEVKRILALFDDLKMNPEEPDADLHNLLRFAEILLIASYSMKQNSVIRPDFNMREDQWLRPILSYIDSHLKENLTLEKISGVFFTSKGNLCRTFRKKTNSTLISYINSQRIHLACILLRQGYSVQETAKEAGFHTVEHFIRTFTASIHCTPGQYAKKIRSGTSVPIPLKVYQNTEGEDTRTKL